MRHSDFARFVKVFELMMRSNHMNQILTICPEKFNDVLAIHGDFSNEKPFINGQSTAICKCQ
jgi:hypothetical protein